ncbi:MAG: SHOCT domain-containing protein, partial [Ruminococcus sp.]|nr:SHOCT domain-containing protein [Ruminococcus sp.]
YQENNYPYGKPDFEFIGPRGRSLLVYEDKCVFIKKGTYGTLIGKTADNEKTIYYHDVVGVKYKRVNNTNGYLQLQTASNITRLNSDDYYDDNTFPFGPDIEDEVKIAAEYIQEKVNNAKTRSTVVATGPISAADEIKKFKELLDMGVITQEEFDAKKKQLLGL